ncbi:MAG TPA: endonuclease, partial [Thermopolyspora sp.]
RLRDEADGDPKRIAQLLTEFPGIGPAGADVFLREVQVVWPKVAPHLDQRVLEGARRLGLPHTARPLAAMVESDDELARLSAAVIRASRTKKTAEVVKDKVKAAAG